MAPQQQQENQHYQEEEEEDDFSFPTTTSSPPRFIGSPRLWRSPSNSLYLLQNPPTTQERNEPDRINLMSYMRSKDGVGENMDVIWEDLNYEEEICSFREKGEYGNSSGKTGEWGRRRRRMDLVKVGGGGKRLSMVVLVNVLKKLFLLHNASRKLDG